MQVHWFSLALAFGVAGALLAAMAQPPASPSPVTEPRPIGQVLDDLHAAASRADFDGYFANFHPAAVFLGTDPGERWTLEEFKAFAKPYFDRGQGWTYIPRPDARNVDINGDTAWFDEVVDNAKYGHCRGTGVLLREDGHWRIAQYSLSVPVPNDLLGRVVEMIREEGER